MSDNFKSKLERVAANSLYTTFTNKKTIEYSFEILKRFLKKGSVLELGPAEGLMTSYLINHDKNMYAIEGSDIFAKKLKKKHPSINVINSLFEEVRLNVKFDNIILGHVLEHVENPQIILSKVKKWLKKDGILFCAVPNARSIHRQAAVEMGLMKSIFNMSEKDKHHGHYRIYSPEMLKSEFIQSEYEIIHSGGYWLKPLSDTQLEKDWTSEMLHAFMKLGEYYPDISAEIYIVAKNRLI
jgi:2-polyprenyl-3-methyl-5-hydroxy-6-metoxy-1,4-benzoquinol methylase